MSADVDKRPLPPIGGCYSGDITYCCCRCLDSIDPTRERYWLTNSRDAWNRPVVIAYHEGDCPPSRRCAYCTLVADHANDCPLSTEPTVVMRPVTRLVAQLIGELECSAPTPETTGEK